MNRTVSWDNQKKQVQMIDQRLLPELYIIVNYTDYHQVADAIRDMVVRGAPAIGAAAAFGMALAAVNSKAASLSELLEELVVAGDILNAARPTAVNLSWAVRIMLDTAHLPASSTAEICDLLVARAQKLADDDVETNRRMAAHGAALIQDGDTIIHHCNTGALATVDWGTALGVIRMAHEQGKKLHVLVDETRPRLQGARLTAWELTQYGIPYDIICDGAAGHFLRTGQVQRVFFGADRVTANGDVANKVGSYMLALAAYSNNVPVYSVFPVSTIDIDLPNGDLIPIEERSMEEGLYIQIKGERITPAGATSRNPAFDVTPHNLLTGLITEEGVICPPYPSKIRRLVHQARALRGEEPQRRKNTPPEAV